MNREICPPAEPSMNIRHFPGKALLTVFTILIGLVNADSALAGRDDPIRRDFDIAGAPKRLYYDFEGFDAVSDRDLERAKEQFADWAEKYWTLYEERGFRSPAHRTEDGVETLWLVHEETGCCSGNFYGGSNPLVTRGPLNGVSESADVSLETVIAHEMFHSVQHRYGHFSHYSANVEEGTATYVPEVLDRWTRAKILDDNDNCNRIYLRGSQGSLFFRPGGGPDESNVCASLWWKYMAQQLATEGLEARAGELDTLRRLLESLEYFGGWRSGADDELLFSEDFNGDDVADTFVRSDRYMGLVSRPFWEPRTWDVKAHGSRIDSGWRFQYTDRTPASCDFVGDSRPEVLIVSNTHIGALEVDGDGNFRNGPITSRTALGYNGTSVDLSRAEFLAGDFDGDGKCEVLMKHTNGLTLLDVGADRFTPSAQVPLYARLGGGWKHRAVDRLAAAGDFDGDGRDEFLLVNDQYIGAGGLDASGSDFVTRAANVAGYQLPGSSVPVGISTDDKVFAGRFVSPDADTIVKAGRRGVLFFSLTPGGWGFRLDGADSYAVYPDSTSMVVADLDGNSIDELVERDYLGAVRAVRPTRGSSVERTTLLEFGTVLDDGEFGGEFRPSFTVYADLELESSGDFNGDGTDDLAVRSENERQVLYAREQDGVIGFTIDRPIRDRERYYGLASGIDRFIRASSGSGRFGRTLASMFSDFAIANLLMDSPDATPRYGYADPDDAETLTYHAVLEHKGVTDELPLTQDPWAISYTKVENSLHPGRVLVEARATLPQAMPRYHLLVFDGTDLIGRYAGSGSYFSQAVNIGYGQHAVLAAVSFEAPLSVTVSASP